jgi:hypothetical protein
MVSGVKLNEGCTKAGQVATELNKLEGLTDVAMIDMPVLVVQKVDWNMELAM